MSSTEVRIPQIVVIPLEAGSVYKDSEVGHVFMSTVNVRGSFRHQGHSTSFTVSYRDETTSTRLVNQGPMVPGAHASLIANASVISAHHFDRPSEIAVQDGDILVFGGKLWQISDSVRYHDPILVDVTASLAR